MSRKKALFVVPLPPPWAGVEQISRVLIGSPLRDRWEISVLKSNVRSSNATKGAWDVQGISRVLWICAQLAVRLLFSRPNLVYLTLSQNASGLARDAAYLSIARLARVPAVAHLHGSQLPAYLASLPTISRRVLLSLLEPARTIVVCADAIGQEVAPFFPMARIRTVYNACPDAVAASDFRPARAQGGVGVAFMGHLSAAKGFYDLVKAAEIVLAAEPGVHFEFAGERLDKERNVSVAASGVWDEVEAVVKRFPGRFRFHGIVEGGEKQSFFRDADIFVLPSHAEAFPVSVLEAIATGLPLVVTRVGALPEVLRDPDNGYFVKAGDVAGLAGRILALARDRALREKIGSANRALAAHFSIETMASRMDAVFQEAL